MTADKPLISAKDLRRLLDYDATTGRFTWKVSRRGQVGPGHAAGSLRKDGYVKIKISGRTYQAHRLAWLYVTGEWPMPQCDHINGNPSDNRIENLRPATILQQSGNRKLPKSNSSGFKGVSFSKQHKKWLAKIKINGAEKFLGHFASLDEAASAYDKAALRYHGEFARTNAQERTPTTLGED